MKRSKTFAIDLEPAERFDLVVPGPSTNTNVSGPARIQVWRIQAHYWLDTPALSERHLMIEGRRYKPDGVDLFRLHVRASITADQLPAGWQDDLAELVGA
jgi:hypothetical protein